MKAIVRVDKCAELVEWTADDVGLRSQSCDPVTNAAV